jgi:hypothetical protein
MTELITTAALEKENREQHSEIVQLYAEVDYYRTALDKIKDAPGMPGEIARYALAHAPRADTRQ